MSTSRRVTHVVLLFLGVAPAVWAVCVMQSDPARACVLVLLAGLGLAFNITALARPDFGTPAPLRVMTCGLAIAVLAYVLGTWQWLQRKYLPQLPPTAMMQRDEALLAAQDYLWIAGAVLYVVVTMLLQPTPPPPKPPPKERKRIDFRTFGK